MVNPRITHTHGICDDCNSTTGYNRTDSTDPLTSPAITILYNDWFQLTGTCDSASDEYAFWELDVTDKLTASYPLWYLRWKTEVASNGLGARAALRCSDASLIWLLGEDEPQFNTTWQVATGTLATGKTIDRIRFYADDYPDSIASGATKVYFDFMLVCEDEFTFPTTKTGKVDLRIRNRIMDIPIPGRVTDATQNLGAESAIIQIVGDMELGDWGTPAGDKLLDIIHNAHSEPFQWFTCDDPKINCKVTIRDFNPFYEAGPDGKPRYSIELKEYSLGDKSEETYSERFGLNL